MKLELVKYKDKKYALVVLKTTKELIIALKVDNISDKEIYLIRSNINMLNKLEYEELIEWFKKNIYSYKKAYRTFKVSDYKLLNQYDIEEP